MARKSRLSERRTELARVLPNASEFDMKYQSGSKMKKEYMTPQVEVVKIQQSQMLCASPMSLDDEIVDVLDDKDAINDVEDIW